jgi:hypothetical protein
MCQAACIRPDLALAGALQQLDLTPLATFAKRRGPPWRRINWTDENNVIVVLSTMLVCFQPS